MPVNTLGQETWPNPIKKAGQLVLEYEDHYIFYLRKQVYRTAAYQNPEDQKEDTDLTEWRRKAEKGEADPEGISLNTALYRVACRSRREEAKDLIVYDNVKDTFYILSDHEKMLQWVYQEKRKDKALMVTPLEAYRRVESPDRVDSNIRSLNPDRF